MPIPLNPNDDLWTHIEINEPEDFLRQFRRTACPVMGDDDIDDDLENPDGGDVENPDSEDKKDEDDRKPDK